MATEDTATDIQLSTHRSGTLARSTRTNDDFCVQVDDASLLAVSIGAGFAAARRRPRRASAAR